jgi:crotonobetainyl-CoA:carnitine CoA-transferase CaiB-like acyl-CoA transferase
MLPLKGIRVLDLMTLSGYCGMELADYGAEVIKIETSCGGDPLRTLTPLKNGLSPHQAFRDRGKKSVTLNLKSPDGQAIFRKLAATADAVLENHPPGVLKALGLDYEAISAIKPSIVYGRISGCGSDGAVADIPQSDLIAQAKSGVMHVTGFPENPPTRIGFSVTERYAASFLSVGVCVAIYHARDTGQGQLVETSLCGSALAVTEDKVLTYSAEGKDPMRTGNAHPQINPYDIIKCKNGYIALSIGSDDQWVKFCDAFGCPEWKTAEKYCSNYVRGLNYFGDLRDEIEALFSAYTMQEIAALCDEILIPGTMCGTTEEALQEPQLHERNMVLTVDGESFGGLVMPGRPIKFAGETEASLRPAPKLGAHNAEIYGALATSEAEIVRLQQEGII